MQRHLYVDLQLQIHDHTLTQRCRCDDMKEMKTNMKVKYNIHTKKSIYIYIYIFEARDKGDKTERGNEDKEQGGDSILCACVHVYRDECVSLCSLLWVFLHCILICPND